MNQQLVYRYTLSLSKMKICLKKKQNNTKQNKTIQTKGKKKVSSGKAEQSCVTQAEFGADWSRWNEFMAVFLRWIRRAASLESPTLINLIYREKTVTYIHTCIHTYIFLLKSFHFCRLQKRLVFSPYKSLSNVTQPPDADARRCSPMLIFRTWATCGEIDQIRYVQNQENILRLHF